MITLVQGELTVPGFHHWPGASGDAKFLSERHHHLFVIKPVWLVNHDDRDVEFITSTSVISKWLSERFGSPAEFGPMSCESIGKAIMEHHDKLVAVGVFEDGRMGAWSVSLVKMLGEP